MLVSGKIHFFRGVAYRSNSLMVDKRVTKVFEVGDQVDEQWILDTHVWWLLKSCKVIELCGAKRWVFLKRTRMVPTYAAYAVHILPSSTGSQ